MGVGFAEWTSSFGVEALALEVLVANGTLETLRMIVAVQCFDPTISGFDRKSTSDALGREQLIPVFFAIR